MAEAARAARGLLGDPRPRVGLILGSGLGGFERRVEGARSCGYGAVPGLVQSTVEGHAGRLVAGLVGGVETLVLSGRLHAYEGHPVADCAFPARLAASLGVRGLVLTNSAGGIRADLSPGDLMLIEDHMNLSGRNPLVGPHDAALGPRFPDMTEAYSRRLREAALGAAAALGLPLARGVYAVLGGPSYETPAEIRALGALGADAVGMSTVYEVVAARQMGVEVLGISCVTNRAAGTGNGALSHQEVLEVGERVRGAFERLLEAVIPRVAAAVEG
ncbi:MAG: purine-nucleoside phosphorylase [Planctomycetes bacterium]|nr:purine-nucleoside phosphorylase [Planctomycetota bacterium]